MAANVRPLHSAIAWLVGAQYVTGPFGMGASYYNYQSQGSAVMVVNRNATMVVLRPASTTSLHLGSLLTLNTCTGRRAHPGKSAR
jgi:hypothetical protein